MILLTVSLIESSQVFTGILLTLKTKPHKPLSKKAAFVSHMSTVFPSGNTTGTVGFMKSFFIQASLVELIVTQRLQFMPHGAISFSFIFLHSFKKVDHCKAPASLSSVITIL